VNQSRQPTRSIVLAGRRVSYTIQESRTARKCRIRVSPSGVAVVLPRGEDEARAAAFLRANSSWVLEQLAFQDRVGSVRAPTAAAPPGSVLLRGRQLRIEIVAARTARRWALIAQQGQTICVRVPDNSRVDAEKALQAWLRRQARSDILARLAVRAAQMKVRPGRVYIRGQKTKWGGCSRRRNLSFNWRLVMAPPEALDYIVVHELAHLIEPYHSARFWLVVRSFCPEYAKWQGWLRDNQGRLGLDP
jgi:predicted metal-dependent hydrolase